MNLENILAVGLAAGYCIIAWRDGSLFLEVIAWLEDGMLAEYFRRAGGRVGKAIGTKLQQLLLCPLCLSPWTSLVIWLLLTWLNESLTISWIVVINALASGAIAWTTYRFLSLKRT